MEELKMPNHVAIIMDGNGRWAEKRGLKRSFGHKAGGVNLEKLLKHIYKKGIKFISIFAFSTENFKRPKEEVDYLMKTFIKYFTDKKKIFVEYKYKIVFSGTKKNLGDDVISSMNELEDMTKDYENGVLNICLNYGGRLEIVDATKKIVEDVQKGILDINNLDERTFNKYLYQDLPDIDFVIRTSGELRISNFMLWQASYAEYYFPQVLFPDFDSKEFDKAIEEYNKRSRRFGGTK